MNSESFFVAKKSENRHDIHFFDTLTRIIKRSEDDGEVYPVCIDEVQYDAIKIHPNNSTITLNKGDLLYFVGGKDYNLNKAFFNEACVSTAEKGVLTQFHLVACEDVNVRRKMELLTEKTVYEFEPDFNEIPYDGLGVEILDGEIVYVSNWWKQTKNETITLPDGIKKIGDFTFAECQNITNLIIPEGVEEIGEGAFASCHNLKTVVLPKSLKKISDLAFSRCDALTTISFDPQFLKNGTRKPFGNLCFSRCPALDPETLTFLQNFEASHAVKLF